ncbi:LuxR family transcriptional regulator [Streptomyces sp. MBT62]|uniref:LuxR family transcriptional regulator n=1 Tax=Streptomyces sp. MBT62 TaxID=2800410 RepID=UPI00190C5D60|nr:LuxR family transcriptional regulator [Streptomyces sp. MBT62]MBK3562348.1 helix-turn-helix domain-containing protein [Streptomyces sp. MBT62]
MTSRPGADLVGRAAELELLDSLLAQREGACRGLLMRGDPGVGKTALLDAAAARAGVLGTRVLRASGVEFEREMNFSALHQMLYPLRRHTGRLAGHHRDVIDRIFGLAPGPAPDPLAASTAVLALLGEVAVQGPLLMIADDVPWLDLASATALGFVVRRMSDHPIAFLATLRTGVRGICGQLALPVREIGPLTEEEAARLLDARWPGLGPSVRRRILAEAGGNPLALRELPAALTGRQRSGQAPLPARLPLSGRLEAAFASAVEALPAPTRTALLMAALDTGIDPAVIRRAARAALEDPADTDAVQSAATRGAVQDSEGVDGLGPGMARSAVADLGGVDGQGPGAVRGAVQGAEGADRHGPGADRGAVQGSQGVDRHGPGTVGGAVQDSLGVDGHGPATSRNAVRDPEGGLVPVAPSNAARVVECPVGADVLGPARDAGLLQVDVGHLSFRHPLVRAVVVHLASPGERRRAHRSLAAALGDVPERRAWHLAESATGPDETVARALDEAALSAWRRGAESVGPGESAPSEGRRVAASAAVSALMRAGELSPHPGDRSRRLVEAAYLATFTGQLDDVPRLLADAGQAPDTPGGLVFAATAHLLTNEEGDVDAAYRLLARALDDDTVTAANDDWDQHGILYALLLVSLYTLRPEPWHLLKTALTRCEPTTATPIRLCYDAYVDPTHAPDALRKGLSDAFDALPADAAPWELIPLAFAAVATDALSDHRYLVFRMIERERDGGAIAMVVPALLLLCQDSYVHGRWDEAEDLAQQGLDLAAAHGYHFWERQIRVLLAVGAALRGDAELARVRSEETTTWAAPRGIEVTEAYARSARRLAAMGEGDYEEAHVQAGRIEPPGPPLFGVPRRWTVLDLAETAVRTGRADEARDHVAAARRASVHRISPRTALICAGAEAVAADETEAGPLFEAALCVPHAARWPWEHARVQLAYGQWLRRTRDHRARRYLSAALETFDRIGAGAMAQRARNELRATGVATTTGPVAPAAALTVQERQIAELAAVGLTNRQIGERLFLSHRTVGSHLHRLYPKLGITSRAALRAALETM